MADISKAIEEAQRRYNEAKAKGDKQGMSNAHAEAEAARASQGYSGGADGSQNIKLSNYSETTPASSSGSNGIVNVIGSMIKNTRAAANDITNGTSPENAASNALNNVASDAVKTFAPSISTPSSNTTSNNPANYDDLISGITSYTRQPTLTWEQAMERAKAQLDPIYSNNMEEVNKMSDYNNLKTGFYGQLPGDVVKRETALKEKANWDSAVASMANQIYNKSIDDANVAEQAFLQKQGILSGLIGNSMEAARAKNNDALNKAVTVAGQTGIFNSFYDTEITDPEVLASYDNIQALIDKIKASPDKEDDKKLPQAYAFRANKLIQNPDLAAKYGSSFMTQEAKNNQFNKDMTVKQYNDSRTDTKFDQDLKTKAFDLQNKELDLDTIYKKAQIANLVADNARQAAAAKSKESQKDPLSTATEDQKWWYYYYKKFYQDPVNGSTEYANNPDKSYQEIVANQQGMIQQLGPELYAQLLKEQTGLSSKVANAKEPTVSATQQKNSDAANLQKIIDSQANPVAYIEKRKYDIINTFGSSFYDSLVKKYTGEGEEWG
jgi:hypothetical protein